MWHGPEDLPPPIPLLSPASLDGGRPSPTYAFVDPGYLKSGMELSVNRAGTDNRRSVRVEIPGRLTCQRQKPTIGHQRVNMTGSQWVHPANPIPLSPEDAIQGGK